MLDVSVIALFRSWRATGFAQVRERGAQINLAVAGGIPRYAGFEEAPRLGTVGDNDLIRSAPGVSGANSLE